MLHHDDKKQPAAYTRVTFKHATKKPGRVPARNYTIKLRAEFCTPKRARADTTFHVNSALKGLNAAMFSIKEGINILREDGKDCFDSNSNFPANEDVKRYYKIDHGNKVHGQNLVTVIFTVIADGNIKKIKQAAGFVEYLQKNYIWVKEHHFESSNVTKIGYMSTTSSSFNYFEDYKRRVQGMMETYMKEIDQEDNSIDEDLRKFAASGKTIPTFEVVVNKVSYRKPDPAKIETSNTQQTAARKKAPALETTAYEIQFELLNANELRMILLVLTNVDPWRVG